MTLPTPPIIADEHGDISIFDSVEQAEEYVEPVDVRNDEYRFYDREGLELDGEVVPDVRHTRVQRIFRLPPADRVRIVASSPERRRPDELSEALQNFLHRVGSELTGKSFEEVAAASLDELVEMIQTVHRS